VLWDMVSGKTWILTGRDDSPTSPPGASPLGRESDSYDVSFQLGLYSGTLSQFLPFEPKRTAKLRLPATVGWEQVEANYQSQLADWTLVEPKPASRLGLSLHVKIWQQQDRHFAVALIDKVLDDFHGPFRILYVMSEPVE
jgi:hypothetical protein